MSEYVTYGGAMRKKAHSKKRGAGEIMGGSIMGGSIVGGAILGGADLMKRHMMGMGEGLVSAGLMSAGARPRAKPKVASMKHLMPHIRGRGIESAGVMSAGAKAGTPAQMRARELFKRRIEYLKKNGMSTRDKGAWAKAKMAVK